MKVLIQRVRHASVVVENKTVGAIEQGLLLFVGFEKQDTPASIEKLANKVLAYRVFADAEGKMNKNVQEVTGGVLVVSQFTLAADTQKGLRPGFSAAATPDVALGLYQHFVAYLQQQYAFIATGQFGADMQIHLLNDGPVTFLLCEP